MALVNPNNLSDSIEDAIAEFHLKKPRFSAKPPSIIILHPCMYYEFMREQIRQACLVKSRSIGMSEITSFNYKGTDVISSYELSKNEVRVY